MLRPEGMERVKQRYMRGVISEEDLERALTGKGLERYITTQTSIEELEAYGWEGEEWEEFKAIIQEGDEIWNYNNLGFTTGSFGIVLLRNGEGVGYIRTGWA